MPYALECTNITKTFGNTPALENATLRVRSGSLTALLGPSGCGKTTLLRLIAGFEQPASGSITITGQKVADEQIMLPAEKRRVGMVFQEYALFQHLSVAQNIAFGLKGSTSEKVARIQAMLDLVGLTGFEARMPHELSGGQQQRIALARALAPQPDILLLDEPFSNLDAALRAQVRAEVKAILRASGTTCIFVTHDQEEALSLADEVAVMQEGVILQVAPPHRLYHEPANRAVAEFVGESNFLKGIATGTLAECELGIIPLQNTITGPVEILIRPENLKLSPANGNANAQITWREFYGHDQRVGLQLTNGCQLTARLGPTDDFAPEQQIMVEIERPALAFATSTT